MSYPKPQFNTRICMHGTANQYSAFSGDPRFYLNECKEMGVSWVKGLTDRDAGATDWIPIAFELGLMPVVRIYQPMPWYLDDTIKGAINKLVGMGVRYIETLNEPDNEQEWNPVPPDWAEQAAVQQTEVARYIQSAGGIPLIAALSTGSPGSYTDMTAKMIEAGGADVFEGDFVMSVHNYPLNHPLGIWDQDETYPYDAANQEGRPLSEEEYRRYGETNSLAWEGRTREMVNQWREEDKNPNATLFTDNCGEINLRYVAECANLTLGFYPNCIVTEGGVIIGDAQDRRYPKNTGEYQRDANCELRRRCDGTSPDVYPDYVLAGGGYWLLGNYRMGHNAPNWESQAWYTDGWPQYNSGGQLWVVDAMKAMPKVAYGDAPPIEPPIEPPIDPPADSGWYIKSQRRVPGDEWGGQGTAVYGTIFDDEGFTRPGIDLKCWWDGIEGPPVVSVTDYEGKYEFAGLTIGQFYVQVLRDESEIAGPLNSDLTPDEEDPPGMTKGHVGFEVDFEWREVEPPIEPPIEPPEVPIVEMLPGIFVEDWRQYIEDMYDWPCEYEERPWPVDPKLIGLCFHWYGAKDGVDPTVEQLAQVAYDKGWCGVSYHYQVLQDGGIRWLNSPEKITYHAKDHNEEYLGVIAEPWKSGLMTKEQTDASRDLWKAIESGLSKELQIVGHKEIVATECPGPMWEMNKTWIIGEQGDDLEERFAKLKAEMARIHAISGEALNI